MSAIKSSRREIVIPDGYELAGYTLQRVDDGHLQHYLPVDVSATPVQAIPLAGYLSDIFVSTAGSLSPAPVTKHASYQDQQPIQEENESLTHSNIKARKLSATTQDRHAHSRDDNYTDVCGVFSSAKATPVKKYNAGNGEFYCPRCGSNYTRPKSVKDHFPHCVSKFGNPQAFRFTDHPSMAQTEAAIQRRRQASLENSNSDTEGNDTEGYHVEGDEDSQGFSFEKINETLARTSIDRDAPSHDVPRIKTEFVFGADIAQESIETPFPDRQSHDRHIPFRPSSSFRSQSYVAQTPDWRRATSSRLDSSTPRPHTNPWNIGIPGSAAEHAIMDMRATAPFEGWPHEAQTPKQKNGDGLQGDGLDGFMDRRSQFSQTPADFQLSSRDGDYEEETEMEDY